MGPDNVIVFGVGPLGGTSIATGRTEVTAKSPETNLLGSSNFGGFFAAELKFAGYDHIVVKGASEKPVYLWIDNDEVQIRDAAALWGKDTYTAPELIRREVNNPDAKIASIGPAGEKLVRFSSVQHEQGHGAGRTGMGAVMGSKKLKAIAVRGTQGIEIADPKKFMEVSADMIRAIQDAEYYPLMTSGTTMGTDEAYSDGTTYGMAWGITPYNEGEMPSMPSTSEIYNKYQPKRAGCLGCPVQCMDHYPGKDGNGGTISCEIYSEFSYRIRCFDGDTTLECGILCQKYGLDSVTMGGILRWLMELHEKGLITAETTDGIPMKWGSPEAIRSILHKTVHREGVGNLLAEGLLSAADHICPGSLEYADHSKGLPMVERQTHGWLPFLKGGSLAAAVGPRGDTMRSCSAIGPEGGLGPEAAKMITGTEKANDPTEYEGKPELVAWEEDMVGISDHLSTCKYLSMWVMGAVTPDFQAALLSAGSGRQTSPEELFVAAARTRTLERTYDAAEGLNRDMEILPKRFLDNPIKGGPWKGNYLERDKFEAMKDHYYAIRNWDVATGIPTRETLEQFGLEDMAYLLEGRKG